MDTQTKRNLGSSFTAASLAVLGLSATLAPMGVSKVVLIAVAISGGVLGVIGVFLSHLWSTDTNAAVQRGADIDAGIAPKVTVTPPPGSLTTTLKP